MSIIYEALKKVDVSGPQNARPKEKNKTTILKNILFYILFICLGALLANFIFSFLSKPAAVSQQKEKTIPVANRDKSDKPAAQEIETGIKKEAGAPLLILQGTFFREGTNSYALINNRAVKEGDTIEGATVLKIGDRYVEIKKEDSFYTLSY